MITISEYLSFFFTTSLLFGISFELPLIMTLLGMLGVIDKKFLVTKRRYAVVLLTVVSAVVAPPDLLSMVMMMVPLLVLFEAGIILVGIFQPKTEAS
jgi:sec-independent protein translocase protein TatC